MARVRILAVDRGHPEDPDVLAAEIAPAAGDEFPGYEFASTGSVVLASGPLARVELIADGEVVGALRAVPRPNAPGLADAPHAGPAGFRGSASVLGLPERFELELVAVGTDGSRVPLATIAGERDRLETGFVPTLAPILLMNHGRSGGTWVTQLLGSHPEIVTYAPFQFEPRLGAYWVSLLKTLAQPASRSQAIEPRFKGNLWWSGIDRPLAPVEPVREPAMLDWLADDAVEEIGAFCQQRIERFYARAAQVQGKERPAFFAERGLLADKLTASLFHELYPDTREVYLVRDFRSVMSSWLSFETDVLGRADTADPEAVRHGVADAAERLLAAWRNRGERSFLLRYEDLMREPEPTLAALFAFLTVDASDATVASTLRHAQEARPERQQAHRTTASPLESIERWRRDLSPELQRVCNEEFAEPLREFGYEVELTSQRPSSSP